MSHLKLKDLNPYDLHKVLINEYYLTTKGASTLLKRDKSKDKTDYDIIKENHQFLWDDDNPNLTWEKRLAKKYYDKLYKEYCICDLSRYKENKVGLRWRTEQELIIGKGHFSCGNKKCLEEEGLKTWEVNFAYIEQELKRNALVKLRLCPDCSSKLNYHSKKREIKRLKKQKQKVRSASPTSSHSQTSDQDVLLAESSGSVSVCDSKETSSEKTNESDVWKQKNSNVEEKSRDEEFEEYLEDLFL